MKILYQDEQLVIFDKPSGIVVHRGWGTDRVNAMTLARDLLGRTVYPVHRLDRGTSGALVFALDTAMAGLLHEAFESGAVRKRYLALVRGVAPAEGVIDHAIANKPDGPRVAAVTEFRRLAAVEGIGSPPARSASLVEAFPRSGRLHQVRRHLKHLSHPVIGDANYGKGDLNRLFRDRYGLRRLALHASRLQLRHPTTGAWIDVAAAVPPDLGEPLTRLGIPESALS